MKFKLLDDVGLFNSTFVDLDHNVISCDLLKHAKFSFIPVLRFSHLNINDKINITIELAHAVVTRISYPHTRYNQLDTINYIKSKYPNLSKRLSDDLCRITEYKSKSDVI